MKFIAVLGGDEAKQQHLLLSQPHDQDGFIKGLRVLATVHLQKVESRSHNWSLMQVAAAVPLRLSSSFLSCTLHAMPIRSQAVECPCDAAAAMGCTGQPPAAATLDPGLCLLLCLGILVMHGTSSQLHLVLLSSVTGREVRHCCYVHVYVPYIR